MPAQEIAAEAIEQGSANGEERRKAVRNILAGSTLVVGAASSGTWVKPAIDAVITPAHVQISTTVVLGGNTSFAVPRGFASTSSSDSILDFVVDSANAEPAFPNFDGACAITSFETGASTFSMTVTFFADQAPIVITGTFVLSGKSFSFGGSGGDVTVTGGVTLDFSSAIGTLVAGGDSYEFTLSAANAVCTPTVPNTTTPNVVVTTCVPSSASGKDSASVATTAMPTTGMSTTVIPTTGAPTTAMPTTPSLVCSVVV